MTGISVSPHRITLELIRYGYANGGSCGCEAQGIHFRLCQFHSGVNEALLEYAVPAIAERDELRQALRSWDFSVAHTPKDLRDSLVDWLIAHFDPDRPYAAIDHISCSLDEHHEATNLILYRLIPDDHWGLAPESNTN